MAALGVWLLLGLEFELAADIVRSVISPTWVEIGQLAAIAVIRTFLNYFLEKVCRAKTRSGDTNVSQRGSPRGPIAGPLSSSSVKLRNLSPSRGARRRKFVAASAPTRRDCSRPGKVVVE